MATVTPIALDGSTVEISSALDLDRPGATSFIVARLGNHLQEFGSGDLDFGDFVAEGHGVSFEEEYSFQGGRLRVGRAEKYDTQVKGGYTLRLGVWQGRSSSVKTVIFNGKSADVVSLFDQFTIEETSSGVVMRPARPSVDIVRDGQHAPDFVKPVPGLGLLDVYALTPDKVRGAPQWGGRRVRGGELFVEIGARREDTTLVLLGRSAFTRIYPDEGTTESDVVAEASELEVAWSA